MTKYVFVSGGVVSSLGKGIAAASLAAILESRKIKVSLVKLDPYINVDPGTMSPFQHGEVFVTEDGAETDLDLGHYERFVSAKMTKANNFTTGQIYERVINEERSKIALFTNVDVRSVISAEDADSIYKIPVALHRQGLDEIVCRKLDLAAYPADLTEWENIVDALENPEHQVDIAMVGKYVDLQDSYKSLSEPLAHAGNHTRTN